ncbi:hypothetical protein ACFQ2J_07965 [Thalassobacillus hwangdonensis]|uniref:GyrI-like small molecule binding domain-containing protein n=2 Tax=Thalassobacillus hwangdonensis TaxID=546108 RepID=A0ABW3KZK4_9BACI
MNRLKEIEGHTGVEVALYEPKKGEQHLEGEYYVGVMMEEPPSQTPDGMEYINLSRDYVSIRGKIGEVGTLHAQLQEFAEETNGKIDSNDWIVETYHPTETGEEVTVYLP